VSRAVYRAVSVPQSLRRLRLRLTIWYAGTFLIILALLGVGLFATITARFDRDLDLSLVDAAKQLSLLARERGAAAAVDQLRIPDRRLAIADTTGLPVAGGALEPWLRSLVQSAAAVPRGQNHSDDDRILRAQAAPFHLPDGRPLVAVAVADEVELEDRYTSLIAEFAAASMIAAFLVAIGGWIVAGQSAAPVERSIEQMRRFMADAAHELRTPLTVVRSRAEVALQRSRSADDYADALRGIERETIRLGRIVEDLLTLARADAGQRPIERERVFLDDVALDAAEAARVIADRKGVRLEVPEFEEAPVIGDAALLRQLGLILLDNAVKFTAPGGLVRIAVRIGSGGAPTLVVSDNGVGIGPEDLPRIFERFYRGDPSRTRSESGGGAGGATEGAGLGLSIAKWIAEEHRAEIQVSSRPGAGTEVKVEFPGIANGGLDRGHSGVSRRSSDSEPRIGPVEAPTDRMAAIASEVSAPRACRRPAISSGISLALLWSRLSLR
jgi:signal transduction histidine kinase